MSMYMSLKCRAGRHQWQWMAEPLSGTRRCMDCLRWDVVPWRLEERLDEKRHAENQATWRSPQAQNEIEMDVAYVSELLREGRWREIRSWIDRRLPNPKARS